MDKEIPKITIGKKEVLLLNMASMCIAEYDFVTPAKFGGYQLNNLLWKAFGLGREYEILLKESYETCASERKALEKARDLFESIITLRAEGVEFFTQSEILDSIARRAHDGYDVCKKALEPQA